MYSGTKALGQGHTPATYARVDAATVSSVASLSAGDVVTTAYSFPPADGQIDRGQTLSGLPEQAGCVMDAESAEVHEKKPRMCIRGSARRSCRAAQATVTIDTWSVACAAEFAGVVVAPNTAYSV